MEICQIYAGNAMNTIHLTSKQISTEYTVIGGQKTDREKKGRKELSIVLLNRGGRPFRRDLFDELTGLGAVEVISIEPTSVLIVGGPAPQIAEYIGRAFGLPHRFPHHHGVANAVGAAVARVTSVITLQADTERG
ncbi:MAG: hypothetical protein GY786_08260, partial [Proteobacteria bacterium]|nr:hypothetical protein [Pseudomonadota bacterium]